VPLSEQYQDDAVGGVNLGSHAGNTVLSGIGNLSGFNSNHAALVLIVVGLAGLWIVSRVFKGA
jgi:uncharacterized membrane protein YuzA (DUF378 family)